MEERNVMLAGFMVPHPPMIVPDVGRGSEKQIEETICAYERVADEIAALEPETIIITSPHSIMYADYFHISPGKGAKGSFSRFGAPQVSFKEEYDTELTDMLCRICEREKISAGTEGERDSSLDHGTMVPLWFIRRRYTAGKIVRIGLSGLPLEEHYRMGMAIREAAEKCGRRIVIIASGDLSHKLQEYGPYGFAPEGPEYDEKIMDVMGRAAFGELLDFDSGFCDRAAECGHRSFVIMAGAFDGTVVRAERLSHQDVTGVGYGICTFYPTVTAGIADMTNPAGTVGADESRHFLDLHLEKAEKELEKKRAASDAYVRLARASVESYVRDRRRISIPDDLPREMLEKRAGAFVSIHKHGELRGCIGTISPVTDCIAQEIIDNAVSAATRDPRFPAIQPDELKWLYISVDVLREAEDIDSKEQLDVKRYGVIVTSGRKRGLLLPDLEGVDTVDKQIEIAKQKAGIRGFEKYSLQRFEVIRHY